MAPIIPRYDDVLAAWATMVRANNEQVERFREDVDDSDFYAPFATSFKADPRRTDEPVLDALLDLVQPGETWLDIGGGAGRYALPLALKAASVTVVDPSEGMLQVLRESMDEFAIQNIEAVHARWPMTGAPTADVAFISHVGYDVEEIGPFLEGMEASARRLCVAVLMDGAPASVASRFWPAVHGEARHELPSLREFLVLLLSWGRLPELRLYPRAPMSYRHAEHALDFLRRQLWVQPGSEKDRVLAAELERTGVATEQGFQLSADPSPVGVVTWAPPVSS